jgi:hypothetical protein
VRNFNFKLDFDEIDRIIFDANSSENSSSETSENLVEDPFAKNTRQ